MGGLPLPVLMHEINIHVYLGIGDWGETFLLEFLCCLFVIPQVKFCTHQDDGCVWTVVTHLRVPLDSKREGRGGRRGEEKGRREGREGGALKLLNHWILKPR